MQLTTTSYMYTITTAVVAVNFIMAVPQCIHDLNLHGQFCVCEEKIGLIFVTFMTDLTLIGG